MNAKRIIRSLFPVLFFCALAGCGGGAGGVEAGNPSQLVIGSLSDSPDCGADQAVATDSAGRTVTAEIAGDCSFELNLPVPAAYRVDFIAAGNASSSMSFNNSPKRFSSPAMNLTPGGGTIYLDRVTVKNDEGTASNEPSAQNDQNENGIPDLFDGDDDGDGISDEDEADCDLDGIIDDFDEVSDCSPGSGDLALEVTPRNGEGEGAHGKKPKLSDDVRVRFSCPIDAASLSASTLTITPEGDPSDVTACGFSLTGSGKQLICSHSDFLTATVYVARLEGARCEGGAEIPAVSWSWKTR